MPLQFKINCYRSDHFRLTAISIINLRLTAICPICFRFDIICPTSFTLILSMLIFRHDWINLRLSKIYEFNLKFAFNNLLEFASLINVATILHLIKLCLATLKSFDTTKQSACGWQYIYNVTGRKLNHG